MKARGVIFSEFLNGEVLPQRLVNRSAMYSISAWFRNYNFVTWGTKSVQLFVYIELMFVEQAQYMQTHPSIQ